MVFWSRILPLFSCLYCLTAVHAGVTVYNQRPLGQSDAPTSTSAQAEPTRPALAAYDPLTLIPPALPDPRPANEFGIQLQAAAENVPGLSIPVSGALFGFSVETSVVNQFMGVNSSFIQVPFLNLLSTVIQRTGRFHIRVGGNTQETARFVESTEDGRMIEKMNVDPNKPTATPVLVYTMELFYLMANISSLLNVKWYLGVPMKDLSDIHLDIVRLGEAHLGDNLLGIQIGNEPDLYERHGARPSPYTPADYVNEFGQVLQAMQDDPLIPRTNNLIGPSVAMAEWSAEMVFDAGLIERYYDNLYLLTVENYPSDNCFAIYGGSGRPHDLQEEFVYFLTHNGEYSGHHIIQKWLNASNFAQSIGKPFVMFETNTASCGGFPGSSNSFGSALWGVDYGMQLAHSNFSHGLLHVGGQSTYYNPALAPPTGQSTFHEWTVFPLMYSVLVVAEALGRSNTSRVIDLWPNNGDPHTPAYAIYEHDTLARVLLINYMNDPSRQSDYTAYISVGGGDTGTPNAVPAQVRVKHLVAESVSDKFNVTWAGQTFGGMFEADGRLHGDEYIETVNCDQAANLCPVKVHAPGVALVFISDQALEEVSPTTIATFETTAVTRTINTATVAAEVLATSNGQNGKNREALGSTSKGSASAASSTYVVPSVTALITLLSTVSIFVRVLAP